MDYRLIVSIGFSALILIDSFSLLAKGDKSSGVLKLLAGLLFAGATVVAFLRASAPSDTLLWTEWALYLVGFIIFIIAAVKRQKTIKEDK